MMGQGHTRLREQAIEEVTWDWEAQFSPRAVVSLGLEGGAMGPNEAVASEAVCCDLN